MRSREGIYPFRAVESNKSFALCICAHEIPKLLESHIAANEDNVIAGWEGVDVSRSWRYHDRLVFICVSDRPD